MPAAVGEEQQLVLGVKSDEFAAAPPALTQAIPPLFHYQAALDEVRAKLAVLEAYIILKWDERKMVHKDPGEKPLTFGRRSALSPNAVDQHPLDAAARGFALKDKAA
jgi:hypothetical protein